MESIVFKSYVLAILAVVMIITGVWLRKKGEPYSTGILTLHKLVVVAMVIFIVLIYTVHFKMFDFGGFGLFLFIFSSVFFIIAFISGVWLLVEKTAKNFLKIIHMVSSIITVIMIPANWIYCH